MTIWNKYNVNQRNEYVAFLQMYGALSGMFNQKSNETGRPYLDSKFQETIYARCFNSEDVDIGNTPHDILSIFGNDRIGIGIKTWLSSKKSYQKVMQLKSYKDKIDPLLKENKKEELAYTLSKIKNDKMRTDYKRLGLSENKNIYHYVTRDEGKMLIQETSYPLIEENKVRPVELTDKSFKFTDGVKDYKYTFGDSQIWMLFGEGVRDTTVIDEVSVNILSDPFGFMKNAFEFKEQNDFIIPQKDDSVYLPLYSYRDKIVPERSGLNAWNGKSKNKGSNMPRPEGEAYIPIPKIFWKKNPHWFGKDINMLDYNDFKRRTGKSSIEINLHMPDGSILPALIAQENFKALQTNPQSKLGKWILNVLGIKKPICKDPSKPSKNIVTMDLFYKKGFDSVKLWREDPNKLRDIWIDFAPLGSFEKYINDEDSEQIQFDNINY